GGFVLALLARIAPCAPPGGRLGRRDGRLVEQRDWTSYRSRHLHGLIVRIEQHLLLEQFAQNLEQAIGHAAKRPIMAVPAGAARLSVWRRSDRVAWRRAPNSRWPAPVFCCGRAGAPRGSCRRGERMSGTEWATKHGEYAAAANQSAAKRAICCH